MSIITMDQIAVMSVQYVHYTFDYYLDSMHQCGIKNLDLWGGLLNLVICRTKTSRDETKSRKSGNEICYVYT